MFVLVQQFYQCEIMTIYQNTEQKFKFLPLLNKEIGTVKRASFKKKKKKETESEISGLIRKNPV